MSIVHHKALFKNSNCSPSRRFGCNFEVERAFLYPVGTITEPFSNLREGRLSNYQKQCYSEEENKPPSGRGL
jgi:hypothetical protein